MNSTIKKMLSVMLSIFMIAGLIPLISLPTASAADFSVAGMDNDLAVEVHRIN